MSGPGHSVKAGELLRAGRPEDAAGEFRAAMRRGDMEEREGRWQEARAAAAAGSRDAAGLLRDYLSEYPYSSVSVRARYMLAEALFGDGLWAAASECYAGVPERELPRRERADYFYRYGYCLFESGDYGRARPLLEKSYGSGEYRTYSAYCLGYMDYAEENYASAEKYFAVAASNPAFAPVIPFYLLRTAYARGDYGYVVSEGDAVLAKAAGETAAETMRIIAQAMFDRGDWQGASDYLSRFAEAGGAPDRGTNYMLGYAAYRQERYGEAAGYFRRACGPDDALSQNAGYHLADCCLRTGDKTEAVQAFAVASRPGFDDTIAEDALFNYGKLMYELGGGYFNEAINVLHRYIDTYPDSPHVPEVRRCLIAAYYNSRDFDAAYRMLESYPNPDNDMKAAMQRTVYFRGLEKYNDKDYDAALVLLEQAASSGPLPKYTALAHYWLGQTAYRRGEYEKALGYFDAYRRLSPASEPENAYARYDAAYCCFALKDWAEAGRRFDDFLSVYRGEDGYRADAFNRRADVEYAGRHYWRAIEFYDKAAAVGTPRKYYSAFQRAMMLGLVDRPQRKAESLIAIIERGEGEYVPVAMYELGRTYVSQGDYTAGAAALERFVAEYPSSEDYAAAMTDLGLVYQNLSMPDRALECYGKVISAAPYSRPARDALTGARGIYVDRNDVDGYYAFAGSFGLESDAGEAQRDSLAYAAARKAYLSGDRRAGARALAGYADAYPKGAYLPQALWYASGCYFQSGETDLGISVLRRLAALPPNDYSAAAFERLGEELYRDGNYRGSAEAYRRSAAIAHDGSASGALVRMLRAENAAGDGSRTIRIADSVASACGDPLVLRTADFVKANALASSGRRAEAMILYRLLSEDSQDAIGAESSYRVIEAACRDGDTVTAEKLVYDFADGNPSDACWLARAFILLGDIYAGRGDTFQARATYQSVADGYSGSGDGIVQEAREKISALK